MAISALGTGSGLDLNSLVEQLLRAERAPAENRLNQRQGRFESQLSALGLFSGALSGLRDAARDFQNARGLGARQAVSSNPDLFTATASERTAPGAFSVKVLSLAAADKRASQAFENSSSVVGTGVLDFSVGGRNFSVAISESNNTLAGIRDAINRATDNSGVAASIINEAGGSRLILTGRNTGVENAISLSVSQATGELGQLASANLQLITSAADARVEIDGFAVNSASNRISGAVDGVTLELKAADPVAVATLRVTENRSAVIERLNTFVQRFNAIADVLSGVAGFNPNTEVAGPLQGNATVRAISSQLRNILGETVAGTIAGASSLSAIGVRFGVDGRLSLDQARLNQVLDERPQALEELLAGDNGIGARLNTFLSGVVGPGGLLEGQTNSLQTRLDDIGRQRAALDARLERVEARFVRQFAALDGLIAELNQTSSFLQQQFSMLENLRAPARRR